MMGMAAMRPPPGFGPFGASAGAKCKEMETRRTGGRTAARSAPGSIPLRIRSRLLLVMTVLFRLVEKRSRPTPKGRAGEEDQNLVRRPTAIRRPSGFDTKPLYPQAPPRMPLVLPL